MFRQHSQNLSDSANIPAHMFLFGARKNIYTAPFPDAQDHAFLKHFDGECLYISVYLRKKIFIPKR